MTEAFDARGTIGVEEEFYAVDPDTLLPVDEADELLRDPPAELDGKLGTELFPWVVETRTERCESLGAAFDDLERKRGALLDHARSHGYDVLAAGLHPTAEWTAHEHVDKPRYHDQLDRIRYPQHRNITAGLHVHVGMDDPDLAVRVADGVRRYLPLFLALSANSPYWYGRDTGLASARAVVFENLPTTGIPTAFGDWATYRRFEDRLVADGTVADRGEIWWDVRPNREHGTVEVRAPDAQTRLDRARGFVALIHDVVTALAERYEAGMEPPRDRRELLDQNKWRAVRHGRDATFVDLAADAGTLGVDAMLDRLLDDVEAPHRGRVEPLRGRTGAERQRDAASDGPHSEARRPVLEALRVDG